ncbi:MAG: S8 family serine peptidase [Pirellulaceae bacterium]
MKRIRRNRPTARQFWFRRQLCTLPESAQFGVISRKLGGAERLEDRRLLAADLIMQSSPEFTEVSEIVLQGDYLPNDTAAALAAVQSVQSQSDATPVFVPELPAIDKTPGEDIPFTRFNTEFASSLAEFREDARFVGIDGTGFVSVVIDTGADLDHPHFGPDSDGDGIADRIVHQQSYTGTATADDDHGHGTHVQGIVGGSDPEYLGVAPESDFVALKTLAGNGRGSFAWLEDALQWVVANATTFNITSVNMSLSDSGFYTEAASRYGIGDELAALEALDVIVVSASGNSYSGSPGVGYPSSDPNSLSIGSERTSGGLSSFSQRDPELTTVFAPGQVIRAAWPGGGVRGLQGTSMASPQVAGVATLAQQLAVQELGRRLTVDEFNQLLRSTGPDAGAIPETGSSYPGVNMVRLGEAILALEGAAVDLEVTQISKTIGGSRGDAGTVEFTVNNQGTEDAPASKLDVYLSRNGTISWTGDYLLGTYDVPALTAGSSVQGALDVTLPEPNDLFWDSDVNYSIGTIIDSDFMVAESDEVNNFNSSAGGDKLDLVIENLPRNLIADNIAIATAPGVWGGVGEVAFDVVNLGGGPAQATSAAIYLSKDSTIDTGSDLLLGAMDVPRVDGGASVSRLMTFELPDSGNAFWDVGITEYYVGVIVDANDSETESDESDNWNRGVGEDVADVPLVPPPSTISGAVFVDRDADGVFGDRFDDAFTVTHNFPGNINPFQAKTFTWTDLPEYRDNAKLTIRMLSDIGAASRNLSVVLDGEVQMVYFAGELPEGTGVVLAERTMDLSGEAWQQVIDDGELQISVDVNFSGSFTSNNRNFIEATLSYDAESQEMASYSQQELASVFR